MRGDAPGSFQLRQLRSAGSCTDSCPLFHSLTHTRPRLSLHMRRAPWSFVGGSTTVESPVRRSMRATKLPASEHHQMSPDGVEQMP